MKKIYSAAIIFVLLMLSCVLTAEPMAIYNEKCDWYEVQTQYYRCTFYNGCMYPVWFTSTDGKAEFPRGFMLDWIKKADAPDTELHYLRYDNYAEIKIIENSDKALTVECTGKFCKGIYSFPGVTAVYRWTLQKNSPEIRLDGTVRFENNAPRQLCLTLLGSMAFDNVPFKQVQTGNAEFKPFRTPGKAPESFTSSSGITLQTADNMFIGITTPAGAWNNSFNRYYTHLSRLAPLDERRWNGNEPLSFSMTFKFIGTAPRREEN